MRISDWSSDVCSSDLRSPRAAPAPRAAALRSGRWRCAGRPPPRARSPHRARDRGGGRRLFWTTRTSNEPQFPFASSEVEMPGGRVRSEEHTSELQSLMSISYAVFGLKKENTILHK